MGDLCSKRWLAKLHLGVVVTGETTTIEQLDLVLVQVQVQVLVLVLDGAYEWNARQRARERQIPACVIVIVLFAVPFEIKKFYPFEPFWPIEYRCESGHWKDLVCARTKASKVDPGSKQEHKEAS